MIKSILRWTLAFLTATVAVIFVAPLTAAASLGAPGVAAYGDDSHGNSAFSVDTATERGPPPACDRHTTYDAVGPWAHGALARPDGRTTSAIYTYDATDLPAQIARGDAHSAGGSEVATDGSGVPLRSGIAANGGSKIPWTSWQNYPKVTQGGREYAQVGDRLYSRHAADRLQPSGLGAPAGQIGAGRSISPNYVEDVLSSTKGVPVKGPHGEPRLSFVSGTVQVITEDNIVITVITR